MQTELVPVDDLVTVHRFDQRGGGRSRAPDLTVEPLFAYPGNADPALERATGPRLEVPATVRQAVRRFIGSVATTAPS